jgi:hypothetical protein
VISILAWLLTISVGATTAYVRTIWNKSPTPRTYVVGKSDNICGQDRTVETAMSTQPKAPIPRTGNALAEYVSENANDAGESVGNW